MQSHNSYLEDILSRNGRSPLKGIDTSFYCSGNLHHLLSRNGESTIKGIDTNHSDFYHLQIFGRSGESPIESIIKKVTQTMIKSPFKAVKW